MREQVLKEWTNLKEKLTERQMVVYQPWTGPQTHYEKDYVKQLSMKDFLSLRTHGKQKGYDQQLKVKDLVQTNLEEKLEKIKELITENKLEKLKWMIKKGEI